MAEISTLLEDELRVAAWADVRKPLERQLAPLGQRALAALAPRPGESVLDIGCGGGETALELAQAVAPDGTVMGIDLSAAVLAFAQRAANGCERVRFVQADAQLFPFEPASFDTAFSRFGVMFFADPTAAFINIRRSLKPNGRLAFVCWRALEENPLEIGTRLDRSHSPIPTACAAFWKARASPRSRLLPVTSWSEAATSTRCWRSVRGSERSAGFFGKIPSASPRRFRPCAPRLQHMMDLMGSG
jgi:SAM-dependent methyltransferase